MVEAFVLCMVLKLWYYCTVDHTLRAGLDDLLRVAQAFVVDDPDKLVRAAAQGHLDVVREVVRKHPSKVQYMLVSRGCLFAYENDD